MSGHGLQLTEKGEYQSSVKGDVRESTLTLVGTARLIPLSLYGFNGLYPPLCIHPPVHCSSRSIK